MKEKLTIGTRGSKLSLAQDDLIIKALKSAAPTVETELRIISVQGDRDKQTSLLTNTTTGKAWFTAEIESALMNGEIDFAMHSLKDVPPETAPGSIIMPILRREDPRDVLVSKNNLTLEKLPHNAIVGTDSSRRKAQLLALRSDLRVMSIRGNIDGRLRKLHEEQYDAIMIAAAGLIRLGLSDVITEYFPAETFIPAPGQGVIAAQVRSDDSEVIELLKRIQEPETVIAVIAERSFIDTVGGSCKSPIGACAIVEGDSLTLYAMMAAEDGTDVRYDKESGSAKEAAAIGAELAERMHG